MSSPTQTLFEPCKSDPAPPDTTDRITTPPPVTQTRTVTYTDENGTHTSESKYTSTPPPTLVPLPNSGKPVNLPAIVGGVVGGIIGILLIIGVVWYLLWRRQQLDDLFEESDDGHDVSAIKHDPKTGRRKRFTLDDDAGARTYQYGMVGTTPSVSPTPYHSQDSSAAFAHGRSNSHTPLIASQSPQSQPLQLNVLGQGGQQRQPSWYAPRPDSLLAPSTATSGRPSSDGSTNQLLRPGSAVYEPPAMYPPGHGGFYQQYGSPQPQTIPSPPRTGEMHKPPLEPTLVNVTHRLPPHMSAPGQAVPLVDLEPSVPSTSTTTAPSIGSSRPYTPADVPKRQETARSQITSPVRQHEDAGRVEESGDLPPPAYSQS